MGPLVTSSDDSAVCDLFIYFFLFGVNEFTYVGVIRIMIEMCISLKTFTLLTAYLVQVVKVDNT